MKKVVSFIFLLTFIFGMTVSTHAEDQGRYGYNPQTRTQSHNPQINSRPSSLYLREVIEKHVQSTMSAGTYDVFDPKWGKDRQLELLTVHKGVRHMDEDYVVCVDFRDIQTRDVLDLDFVLNVVNDQGRLKVGDILVHKVNAKKRFDYNDHNERLSVGSDMIEVKGNFQPKS